MKLVRSSNRVTFRIGGVINDVRNRNLMILLESAVNNVVNLGRLGKSSTWQPFPLASATDKRQELITTL